MYTTCLKSICSHGAGAGARPAGGMATGVHTVRRGLVWPHLPQEPAGVARELGETLQDDELRAMIDEFDRDCDDESAFVYARLHINVLYPFICIRLPDKLTFRCNQFSVNGANIYLVTRVLR